MKKSTQKIIQPIIHFVTSTTVKGVLIIGLIIAVIGFGFLYASGKIGNHGVTASKFVDLQEGKTPFKGFRRAHAKGICVRGAFISNGSLTQHSTSEFFKRGKHGFIGRYSIAGNNPTAPDLKAPVRSMALSFTSESGENWRTAMNTPPVMPVSNPEDFYQQLVALTSGDPQQVKDFFAAHPESAAFNQWRAAYQPTSSFALETYHSINAFHLIDAEGSKQAIRWMLIPKNETKGRGAMNGSQVDALQNDLAARLEAGPITYDWVFILASEDDDEKDPTVQWPETREQVKAGVVEVTSWQAQDKGSCNDINYDPLVLPEGMAASADPILRARSAAYAESYKRRAIETFFESKGDTP